MTRAAPRGRAALKHHGLPCPDQFQPHIPKAFDTGAMASLGIASHSPPGRSLNGSIRRHCHYVTISVSGGIGRGRILDIALSREQLADLLTAHGTVPVTLDYYTGDDGMRERRAVTERASAKVLAEALAYCRKNRAKLGATRADALIRALEQAEMQAGPNALPIGEAERERAVLMRPRKRRSAARRG